MLLRERVTKYFKAPESPEPQKEAATQSYVDMQSDKDHKVYDDIANDPIVDEIPDFDRKEAIGSAMELYLATKANVAPVITGFANDLLKNADGRQIVFAARDGLGAYEAAKALVEKFPEEYNCKRDDLVFAYLTRRLVGNTDPATLTEYLEQEGVTNVNEPVVLADIGMYGTIMYSMGQVLPKVEARYLISENPSIPGYAHNQGTHQLKSFQSIMGNPAVHFMEDTFSGTTSSPSRLERGDNGELKPNYTQDAFEPSELLKRKYAIQAIKDYASEIEHAPTDTESVKAIDKLDEFLTDDDNYAHIMVPHIR